MVHPLNQLSDALNAPTKFTLSNQAELSPSKEAKFSNGLVAVGIKGDPAFAASVNAKAAASSK